MAKENTSPYIKGIYPYPDGSVKVWFTNKKVRIFPSIESEREYIETHAKEFK